jgi:hypothetical protein
MANQTLPRHAAFFKEQRDLRREGDELGAWTHSAPSFSTSEDSMRFFLCRSSQILFWAILLAEIERQQHNPLLGIRR